MHADLPIFTDRDRYTYRHPEASDIAGCELKCIGNRRQENEKERRSMKRLYGENEEEEEEKEERLVLTCFDLL